MREVPDPVNGSADALLNIAADIESLCSKLRGVVAQQMMVIQDHEEQMRAHRRSVDRMRSLQDHDEPPSRAA